MLFRYSKSKLREGVTRITDGIVNESLIEGRDRAVLFDTGLDIFNIREYIAKLTDKKLIVKDFTGHTPGSITLLDPALKSIYTGDASDMDIRMFTNPGCSLHEYAETGRTSAAEHESFLLIFLYIRCIFIFDTIVSGKELVFCNVPSAGARSRFTISAPTANTAA